MRFCSRGGGLVKIIKGCVGGNNDLINDLMLAWMNE